MDGGFGDRIETLIDGTLLAVLEQSQDCIKIISADGELTYMNDNGRMAMQIDSFDLVSGRPWYELWPEDARAQVIGSLERARRGERSRFEAFCPTARGEPRWWDVAVSPAFDGDGQVAHIVSTSRDVTGRQTQLESAERDAEIAEIVANEMRHRLQNLVTVVSSMAKLIAQRSDTLDTFTNSFQRQLLHLDRAQALLIDGRARTVGQVVAAVLDGEGRDPRMTIGPLPTSRIGDRAVQLLALVLGELRTNAIKHGALSEANGTVTLEVVMDGEDAVLTWIEDAGADRAEPVLSGGAGLELIRRMVATTGTPAGIGWTGRGLRTVIRTPLT